jgi:glucokinase
MRGQEGDRGARDGEGTRKGSRHAGATVENGVVLAFDFGGSKVGVAIADLKGARLAEATTATQPSRGARWNFVQAIETARKLMGTMPGTTELTAVGASTFGIPTERGVLLSPAIPGWDRLELRRELVEALDCPFVRVRTDVKSAAEAEARSGALVDADPGLYLNLGTGLAVGIVSRGEVIDGANGAAGEIGYNLRQVVDLDSTGHGNARLESVVSGMALAAAGGRATGAELVAADVFAGEAGNDGLAVVLDEFLRELSFHLVNLVITLNPTRVAVGGGIVRSWARIEPALGRALQTFVPFPPELVPGAYPFDAALVGAISLGLSEAHVPLRARVGPDDHLRRNEHVTSM